jgi:hypothetical protein
MNKAVGVKSSSFITRIAAGIAVAAASLTASLAAPSTVHAEDAPCFVNGRQVQVHFSYNVWVDARTLSTQAAVLQPGMAINVTYLSGRVWSGAWFTTPNGPEGWVGWRAPTSQYGNNLVGPLSTWAAPGHTLYSLVAQIVPRNRTGLGWNNPFFRPTTGADRCIQAGTESTYNMTMNDERFDDNTGGFWVHVDVLR